MTEEPVESEWDVVVVGAGPAGVAAGCAAAEAGKRVLVLDESPWLGGQIWRGAEAKQKPAAARVWLDRLRASGARVERNACVVAALGAQRLLVESRGAAQLVRWRKLILAVGARELLLPFPGWTLPHVFGVGGLQALAKAGWPVEGKRVVLAGSGPLLLAVADGLKTMGANVLLVAEQAPWPRVMAFAGGLVARPGKLREAVGLKWRLRGVPYRCGVWPVAVEGDCKVERVRLTDGSKSWKLECDYLGCGFGLVANLELPLAVGCAVREGFVEVDEHQRTSVDSVYCAGEPTGIGGVDCALVEGEIAGLCAAEQFQQARLLFSKRAAAHRFRDRLRAAFELTAPVAKLCEPDTIVCRCEDVVFGRLCGRASWREAKLQTRCGMGACQGRVCGAAARVLFGWGVDSVRPPVVMTEIGSLMHLAEDS